MKIAYLKNHPVIALRLAELCGGEWQQLYTGWNREVALREFESQRADGALPLSLVAIEQDELLGMVSIIFDDLPGYEHLNPWLASLFVLPGHRGKETGSHLVREAEKLLANNGVATAYLSVLREPLGTDYPGRCAATPRHVPERDRQLPPSLFYRHRPAKYLQHHGRESHGL